MLSTYRVMPFSIRKLLSATNAACGRELKDLVSQRIKVLVDFATPR